MNRILALSAFAAALLGVAVPFAATTAVNLNTATHDELVAVPGIGPTKAQAIVEHRTTHGPFNSVDDLKEVKGFRAKLVEKLRHEFTVAAPAPRAAPKGEAKSAAKVEAKRGKEAVVASGRIADEKPRR